ncbi:ABC transporter permease [Microbacterium sp. dk485]|uniref:ABC transporter permease n=1 Tax=Microbacterium sp. dk485 TaxID=2560021 RepID=UPI001073E412|nr:ABC transporter permease [Microbacterium sp. dk485]TFV84959.1 ABC transporter permease [Microbacterium sp. dk485]
MAALTPLDAAPATVRRTPSKPVLLVGLTAGLGVILVALLMLFIMPSLKSGAHNLPIGLAGPSSAVTQVEEGLDAGAPGAYTTRAFASEAALRDAVLDRDVVGGILVDEGGVHALVVGAGSTAISATISGTAQSLAEKAGTSAEIEDVVPLPESDPTGVGIGGLAFPLVFGGIVPAVAFRKVFSRSLGWAVGGILAFAAVGGIVVAAVLMFLFGSITTAFWPVAAAMALGVAGLALPLAGLQEVFGGKGFTIGAMIMMFVGNPLAGIATGAAWLPAGLGAIGQILPPGAAGTLVRSAAYFGGAGGLAAGLTLAAWVAAGALLLAVGARRTHLLSPSR